MTRFKATFQFVKLAILGGGAFNALLAIAAPITLTNNDFETGSLSGWSTIGNVIATPSTSVTTFNGTTYAIGAAGTTMAQLTSSGASVVDIESGLGLASGTLDAYNFNPNNGALTSGSALYQRFSGNLGATLSFAWNYVATDYIPFNDPAFAVLIGPSNDIQVLASIDGLGTAVGTAGNSGWQSYVGTLGSTGDYTLAFITTNDKDETLNSVLHIDSIAGTCEPSCPSPNPVPEPGSLAVVCLGLVALGATRKRKRA